MTDQEKEEFVQAMKFCKSHANCPPYCPDYEKCKGSYDMLYRAFQYIEDLTDENERLKNWRKK
jgi:hypothetical protein